MAGYYQTEGVNTYFVADVDISAMNSYETEMLYNNFIDGIIQPEFRALNSEMMVYSRINGMRALADVMEESGITELQAAHLFAAICDVADEVGEYMLSPDNLLVELDRIFFEQGTGCCRFVYVPGNGRDIRGQIKRLIEDLLRKINHRDHGITDFMYGLYDMSLGENFDMESLREHVKKREEELTDRESSQTSHASQVSHASRAGQLSQADRTYPAHQISPEDREALLDTVCGESARDGDSDRKQKRKSEDGVPARKWIAAAAIVTLTAGILTGVYQYANGGGITDVRPFMLAVACLALEAYAYLEIKKRMPSVAPACQQVAGFAEVCGCEPMTSDNRELPKKPVDGQLMSDTNKDKAESGEDIRRIRAAADMKNAEDIKGMTTVLTAETEAYGETQLLQSPAAAMDVCKKMSTPKYRLYFLPDDDGERKTLDIAGSDAVIGRNADGADMVIDDSAVSRRHAVIWGDTEGVYIRDDGSANGTYVNGVRLAEGDKHKIESDGKVKFGRREYTLLINRL